MNDLISRQAAIEAIEREKSLVERPITETRWFDLGLGKAQDVLSELPSAQPETHEKRMETHACDLIDREAAIDALHMHLMYRMGTDSNKKRLDDWINGVPSVQPENQVHLCDSCRHVYPECPSEEDDVIYGNGKGNDNICACNKYEPSAQPADVVEVVRCENCEYYRNMVCQNPNGLPRYLDGNEFCSYGIPNRKAGMKERS